MESVKDVGFQHVQRMAILLFITKITNQLIRIGKILSFTVEDVTVLLRVMIRKREIYVSQRNGSW